MVIIIYQYIGGIMCIVFHASSFENKISNQLQNYRYILNIP